MLTTHDLLWGIVYPAILALIALIVGRFIQRERRMAAPWAVALAIGGGFILAFFGISGRIIFPPVAAQDWLAPASVAAIIVAAAATYARRFPWYAVLSIFVLIATACALVHGRQHALSNEAFRKLLALAVMGGIAWWIAMEPLAMRMRGALLPFLLSGVIGSAALVLVNGGTQRLGQVEGGVAVVLLVIAAMGLWLRDLTLARGGILVIAIVGLGLLLCGYLFADVTWIDVAILCVAPLFAWVLEIPGIRGRKPWVRLAIGVVLVLGFASISLVPALKGLRQTMKEQTESYQM